jgi:hypothetical protein
MSDESPVGQSRTDSEAAAMAAEYARLRALEDERRRRHDSLEALLPAIAEALDVPRGRFYSLLRRHGVTEARR